MSLRGFHLVFISVCTALFAFLTAWGFFLAADRGEVAVKMGIAGIFGILVLPAYAAYFLRKARRLNL